MADQNKWALLIGINDYRHMPQLSGPVNDTWLMEDVLQSNFGFPPENIIRLLDAEATREHILDAIDRLLQQVHNDDIAVIYFSGHGGNIPDLTGNWQGGRVSTIIPYDSGREPDPILDLTYDELCEPFVLLTKVTPHITVIFDSDHAGTLGPCLKYDKRLQNRYVFLGSTGIDEEAFEYRFGNVFHGVFTYNLVQTLVNAKPDATYQYIFEQVSREVISIVQEQHPQIEGQSDQILFGASKVEKMEFIPVNNRSESSVVLGAGAAHGLTEGSHWVIYPEGILEATRDTPRLGLVEIKSVGVIESEANILSEAEHEAIKIGTNAIEETHNFGEMRMVVDTLADDVDLRKHEERLRELLRESDLVRIAAPDERANVKVRLIPPRSKVRTTDRLLQLGLFDKPIWALVNENDRLMEPIYMIEDRSAVWEIRDYLENLARYRNILNLKNPNMNNPLLDKLDFIVQRQIDAGTWVETVPDSKSGMVIVEDEDLLRFIITNKHEESLYVSLLDFPREGSFSLIFPAFGESEGIKPSENLTLEVTMFIPVLGEQSKLDDPSSIDTPEKEQDGIYIDTVKLFATASPIDFGALVMQDGMRGLTYSLGEKTMFWQLLDLALTGRGKRESWPVKLPLEQDWITIEHLFAIRRKGEV